MNERKKILSLDMGGTNLDGVVLENFRVTKSIKTPIDPDDLAGSVTRCLAELTGRDDPESWTEIHLSTTLTTNCIAQRRLDPVTLVIQVGPGLVEDYAAEGLDLHELSGAIDHRGIVTQKVSDRELSQLSTALRPDDFPQLAVVCKFGTRNPQYEQELASKLRAPFESVTLGHLLSGSLNFPRRVRTAWFNAAVTRIFKHFAISVEEGLHAAGIKAPIYILKADAGTLPLEIAKEQPVQSILSGPAASYLGFRALMPTEEDAILLDIGGTTTDIFYLVAGEPLFEVEGASIGGYKTLVRSLFTDTLALGGDSFVHWDEGVQIGPGRSSTPPTLSDAYRLLGRLSDDADPSVFENFARDHGREPQEMAHDVAKLAARKIYDTVEARLQELHRRPLYTVREVLEDRRLEPNVWQVIGGPAHALKPELDELLSLPVQVPEQAEVANAIGAAYARPTQILTLHADTEAGVLRIPELGVQEQIRRTYDMPLAKERLMHELSNQARKLGLSEDNIEVIEEQRFLMLDGFRQGLNLRLQGQIRPGLMSEGVPHES